jgi:hypothetical protein
MTASASTPALGPFHYRSRQTGPKVLGSIAVDFIGEVRYQRSTVRLFFFADLRLVVQHRVQ